MHDFSPLNNPSSPSSHATMWAALAALNFFVVNYFCAHFGLFNIILYGSLLLLYCLMEKIGSRHNFHEQHGQWQSFMQFFYGSIKCVIECDLALSLAKKLWDWWIVIN